MPTKNTAWVDIALHPRFNNATLLQLKAPYPMQLTATPFLSAGHPLSALSKGAFITAQKSVAATQFSAKIPLWRTLLLGTALAGQAAHGITHLVPITVIAQNFLSKKIPDRHTAAATCSTHSHEENPFHNWVDIISLLSLALLALSYGLSKVKDRQWKSGKAMDTLNKALEEAHAPFRVALLHGGSQKHPLKAVQQNVAELQKVLEKATKQISDPPTDLPKHLIPLWEALMKAKSKGAPLKALSPYFHQMGLTIVPVKSLNTQA